MKKSHKWDHDYSDLLPVATEPDFAIDYTEHYFNDHSYKEKHQPSGPLIVGLRNIVCPWYPDYHRYDTGELTKNFGIKDSGELSNSEESVKSFSIKQWLFDFFTLNMVWEPATPKVQDPNKPPVVSVGPNDILRSHDLQFRHNLERQYISQNDDTPIKNAKLLTVACQSKLTLSTKILISFDVNSGVAQEITPIYVLPTSLLTVDVNPSWTQQLQIQFVLANTQNNDLCQKLLQIKPLGSS